VIEEEERIYGDGVNVAARVEGLADAGGICISGTAFDQVRNKLSVGYEYIGEQTVKNIPEPVRVYRVLMEPEAAGKVIGEKKPGLVRGQRAGLAAAVIVVVAALAIWYFHFRPSPMEVAFEEKMAFPLPEKPSIAVLPFDNLTGDPQQEYFSDGMTEEIITGLSKVPYLFVIARNSTFSYKGKPVKIHQVAEELGVRYVLEGSFRKVEHRVRVTAQLIDALTGHHMWAERYDRDLKDIFALQDEITMKIIEALEVKLTEGEQARMRRKGTDELEAYIKTLHGVAYLRQFNKDGNILARQMGEQAIALDPEYARPYVVLGWTHLLDIFYGSTKSPKNSMERAMELVQKSISLDEFEPCSRDLLSYIYLLEGQHERAIAESERGVSLDPNMADSQMHLAMALSFAGRPEEAIALLKKAIRLNPFAPTNYWHNLGRAYRLAWRYEEAVEAYKKALKLAPDNLLAHVGLAATYSLSGQEDEAQAEAKQVLRVQPKFSVERFAKKLPFKDRSETERLIEALRKAGLPEKPPLPLPDKPSIAVLPFTNMSEDPKQEYFSDGITEQIITSLSKVSDLFVIARTSSFKYKRKEVDVKLVGRELGVRYVLEGSVQRSGDRVRINAQLIDTSTGHHLWAERYDRDLTEIFALQDEITKKIITSLHVKLTMGEDARRFAQSTDNLEAYLKFLEANKIYQRYNKDTNIIARQMFKEAIALDANYVQAYALLAWTHLLDAAYGWTKSRAKSLEAANELAQKLLSLDDSHPGGYVALSSVHLQKGEIREAVALREKAVALSPNSANIHNLLGVALLFEGGRTEEAIKEFKIANRLDPFPPNHVLHYTGVAYRVNGEYEKAIEFFKKVINRNPDYWLSHFGLAACYGLLGREEEARAAAAEVLRIRPNFSIEKVYTPYRDKADKVRTFEVLRKAGLK